MCQKLEKILVKEGAVVKWLLPGQEQEEEEASSSSLPLPLLPSHPSASKMDPRLLWPLLLLLPLATKAAESEYVDEEYDAVVLEGRNFFPLLNLSLNFPNHYLQYLVTTMQCESEQGKEMMKL